jgi:hypothetical protein
MKGIDGFVEDILFLNGGALECGELVTDFLDYFLEILYFVVRAPLLCMKGCT